MRLGFRLGRSRVAVLSADRGERLACNLSGNCLYGCSRGAMYAAGQDVQVLRRHRNFTFQPGFVASDLKRDVAQWVIAGHGPDGRDSVLRASKVVLAAGTIATTRLVLRALGHTRAVPLLSAPTAAFLLWQPSMLGTQRTRGFGLGQLSFTLSLAGDVTAFGSTFATSPPSALSAPGGSNFGGGGPPICCS